MTELLSIQAAINKAMRNPVPSPCPLFSLPRLDETTLSRFKSGTWFSLSESKEYLQVYSQTLLAAHQAGLVELEKLNTIPAINPLKTVSQLVAQAESVLNTQMQARINHFSIECNPERLYRPNIEWTLASFDNGSCQNDPEAVVGVAVEMAYYDIETLYHEPITIQFAVYSCLELINDLLLPLTLPHDYLSGSMDFQLEELIDIFRDFKRRGLLTCDHETAKYSLEDNDEGLTQANHEYYKGEYEMWFGNFFDAWEQVQPYLDPPPVWMQSSLSDPWEKLQSVQAQISLWKKNNDPLRASWWGCYVHTVSQFIAETFPSHQAIKKWVNNVQRFRIDEQGDNPGLYSGIWINDNSEAFRINFEDANNHAMEVGEIPRISFTLVKQRGSHLVANHESFEILKKMADGFSLLLLADQINANCRE